VAPVTTPAVLLRAHDYGETSRILRFYTRDHGLVSVVAKGVRGRSGKGRTALATFATGELTAYVKARRDLHTMKDFECGRLRQRLGSHMVRFAGAAAVAELVVAHADQEPHPALFGALEGALDQLESADPSVLPSTALAALWGVVVGFGFAPQLEPCVRCGAPLQPEEMGRFDLAAGGVRCARCGEDSAGARVGPGARRQLARLVAGRADPPVSHPRRHLALLADFVAYHVAARPLKSLTFLGEVLPADGEEEP
jgi:DNA repair protein RecO (recombination protein O)